MRMDCFEFGVGNDNIIVEFLNQYAAQYEHFIAFFVGHIDAGFGLVEW